MILGSEKHRRDERGRPRREPMAVLNGIFWVLRMEGFTVKISDLSDMSSLVSEMS